MSDVRAGVLPGFLRLGHYLSYLRMDKVYLGTLLEANWPGLAALREMLIHVHANGTRPQKLWPMALDAPDGPDDDGRRPYLRCSAATLQTLTLSARDAAMALNLREISLLGYALAQSERRGAQERESLVFVGIGFTKPEPEALHLQIFSSVQFRVFTGAGSSGNCEGGL